jgi:hypothetical protein
MMVIFMRVSISIMIIIATIMNAIIKEMNKEKENFICQTVLVKI